MALCVDHPGRFLAKRFATAAAPAVVEPCWLGGRIDPARFMRAPHCDLRLIRGFVKKLSASWASVLQSN